MLGERVSQQVAKDQLLLLIIKVFQRTEQADQTIHLLTARAGKIESVSPFCQKGKVFISQIFRQAIDRSEVIF